MILGLGVSRRPVNAALAPRCRRRSRHFAITRARSRACRRGSEGESGCWRRLAERPHARCDLRDRSDFTLPRTARGVPRRRCRSANLVPADRCRRRAPGHPNLPASSRDLNDRRRRPPGQRFNDIKRGPTAWPASSTASRRIAYRLFQRGPMTLTFRISLLAIGLASLLGPDGASAGTLVEFPNLPGHTPANLSG